MSTRSRLRLHAHARCLIRAAALTAAVVLPSIASSRAGTIAAPAPSSSVQAVQQTPHDRPAIVSSKLLAPGLHELVFADGSIYRGTLRGTTFQGHGEFISRGFRYEGDYRDGVREGLGTYSWPNGDRYEGRFLADLPDDAHATYLFANGDRYEGEVRKGLIEGRGRYTSRAGDRFEGMFRNGVPDGEGTYLFANGDRYDGEVSSGRIHGHGRYRSARGDVIEASFADGRASGIGRLAYANGDVYEGELASGVPSGQGAFTYRTGLRYEGEVRDGAPRGKGVVVFADGRRFEGLFEGTIAGARGELVLPDGTRSPAELHGDAPARLEGGPSGIIPRPNTESSHG